ncbi:signal recognition particle receptor subunit beta [Aethina tumida]|uniref:signal recognition particle receptor subunit beta n=1 Tax=Aethina tumida TaxID=116153 RepID=UPI00096ADC6F|nr:signal recognition particle receptor subunit beta [Aethina tumida]
MEKKEEPIEIENTNYYPILIALVVILITVVIFALYKRKKTSRRGILITGLCDSGKTVIFSQLVHNKYVETHTSIKENIGNYTVNNQTLKIIDIPGHERLRDKFFEEHKNSAKGIVFVIDSVTLQQDVRDAADFLYNVLTDTTVTSICPKILILCNKQDHTLAKGCNIIKSILEKELNTLRFTKAHQLESVDSKSKKNSGLGDMDKDFEFSELPFKVEFEESYGCNKQKASDLDDLKNWLAKIA